MDVDSGLEILHGGVGGDVEQGTRTSKHILDFAFDPFVSKLSLFTFVQSIIHIIISYLLALSIIHIISNCLCCLAYIHIAYSSYMLGCLCVPHLYLINKSFT